MISNWYMDTVWTMQFAWNGTNDTQAVDVVASDINIAKEIAIDYFKRVFGKEAGSKFQFVKLIAQGDVVVEEAQNDQPKN